MAEEETTPEHPGITASKADKELLDQTSYSDVVVGPQFDQTFDPHYAAIEVQSDGDVEIITGAGNTVALSLVSGRIYPIEIQEVVSGNTQVSQSDIWVYAA